ELPLLVTEITSETAWSRLQQTLANAYPATHGVTILHCFPDHQPVVYPVLLADLATVAPGQVATPTPGENGALALCVPPLPEGSSFGALQAIVAHLRSPVGCPWDREQTLRSMRHDLLGECVEVMEAIDRELDGSDNGEHIAEELGDLFMAGVLTLQIAIDEGRFHLADAMQSIVTKLIRRHPHVFGATEVDGVAAVWANWDAIKKQEKLAKGQAIGHPLDGIPAALPALEKARELQSKAQKANLLDRAAVAAEFHTQLFAVRDAVEQGTLTEQAMGSLLWTLVAVAERAGINAEDALRSTCVTFRARQSA
ncbi:MAG: MazG family protein, partial [Caldilineaceae bacterium]|nr:MazG family protein [Caldilineaceae bacterium]